MPHGEAWGRAHGAKSRWRFWGSGRFPGEMAGGGYELWRCPGALWRSEELPWGWRALHEERFGFCGVRRNPAAASQPVRLHPGYILYLLRWRRGAVCGSLSFPCSEGGRRGVNGAATPWGYQKLLVGGLDAPLRASQCPGAAFSYGGTEEYV